MITHDDTAWPEAVAVWRGREELNRSSVGRLSEAAAAPVARAQEDHRGVGATRDLTPKPVAAFAFFGT